MKTKDSVRENLIEMLEELDERLDKITADVRHENEPLSSDFEEQATESENNEVLDSLGNAARSEIAKVQQAIRRLDQGEYGRCVQCGCIIPEPRLEILPYTDKCVSCAEAEDRAP